MTNEEVRIKIQTATREYYELLTLVMKQKLRWFSQVSRSSGVAKTIRHSERAKTKRQAEEEVGRQYQRVDRNGLCQLNLGS